jgi:hypothetical protein
VCGRLVSSYAKAARRSGGTARITLRTRTRRRANIVWQVYHDPRRLVNPPVTPWRPRQMGSAPSALPRKRFVLGDRPSGLRRNCVERHGVDVGACNRAAVVDRGRIRRRERRMKCCVVQARVRRTANRSASRNSRRIEANRHPNRAARSVTLLFRRDRRRSRTNGVRRDVWPDRATHVALGHRTIEGWRTRFRRASRVSSTPTTSPTSLSSSYAPQRVANLVFRVIPVRILSDCLL